MVTGRRNASENPRIIVWPAMHELPLVEDARSRYLKRQNAKGLNRTEGLFTLA